MYVHMRRRVHILANLVVGKGLISPQVIIPRSQLPSPGSGPGLLSPGENIGLLRHRGSDRVDWVGKRAGGDNSGSDGKAVEPGIPSYF